MVGESVSRWHDVPAEQVAEDDYQSFCEALGSTARGRAFLDEYARRNRQVDTEVVLAALDRLEIAARSQASSGADRIRQDLKALLDTLRSARPQTENLPTAIKAATLAALIDFTQARIEALVLPAREDEPLAAVPVEEQPELPIPHPVAVAPQMTLVQPMLLSEAPPAESAPPPAAPPEAKRKTATIIPIVEFDYHGHPSGRAAPLRSEPDEAWSMLAPPTVAMPSVIMPAVVVPAVAVPAVAMPVVEPAATAPAVVATPAPPLAEAPIAPAPIVEPSVARMPLAAPALPEVAAPQKPQKAEVEPYELWLDPPATAKAEPEPTSAPAVDPMPDVAIISEIAVVEMAVSDAVAEPAAPSAEAAISTIETLMQQMEQTAPPAPATKGRIEMPDPLAPLMALSEEERIALFT